MFSLQVTEGAKAAAKVVRSSCMSLEELDLAAGAEAAESRSAKYKKLYYDMLREILDLLSSDKL